MEYFDSEKAKRVWQRVQGTATDLHTDSSLPELLAGALEDSAVYLGLSRRFRGHSKLILQKLHKEKQEQAAVLRGLCAVNAHSLPRPSRPKPPTGSAEALQRRCCGRSQQALQAYEQSAQDSGYAPVFRQLARQEQEVYAAILKLLGQLSSVNREVRHGHR